jgi:hypothetical protein
MENQRTIILTSSQDMVLVLVGRISAALTPTANETGLDATLNITRDDENLITAVSVTVPHYTWELPLLRGIADAIYEHQDIVYVSGWGSLCEKLFRIPWFRPLTANIAETTKPTWLYSPTGRLSEVGRLVEVNRLLCSWIFVSNVVHALDYKFGDEEYGLDEFHLVHPAVAEEVPYRMYSQVASAWCETIRLPHHLLAGAKIVMADKWKPAMTTWLLGLRPDLRCEVSQTDGRYSCLITGSRPMIALLERALLCLGNLIVAGSRDYLNGLRVDPDMGNRVFMNQVNPNPTMHTILVAPLKELGLRPSLALELPDKPNLIFNSYGQPYLTIAGSTPIDEAHLEQLRMAAKEAHDDLLARRDEAR